jgi:hypothetical protein
MVKTKYRRKAENNATYVANIFSPRTLMISEIQSIIAIVENSICNIIVENCAPY